MCGFEAQIYGAQNYPDALCHDGFLIDMDRGYSTDYDLPCPKCNIREFAAQCDYRPSGNSQQRRTKIRKFQRNVIKKYGWL